MKQNSRKSPTHLAVRRHGLPHIRPPLAAVGCAGESVLRTGGTCEPTRESGRYDIEGRRRYSANRPLDCLPAPPGVGERYELPKGSSWSLHLLAGASSGGHHTAINIQVQDVSFVLQIDSSRSPLCPPKLACVPHRRLSAPSVTLRRSCPLTPGVALLTGEVIGGI